MRLHANGRDSPKFKIRRLVLHAHYDGFDFMER
jgi:hypothetical protein